jgi:hypothetical protein
MSEKRPTRDQLERLIDLAARQSALDNETIYNLRAEIDGYDKICTGVRSELTAAGIPELTEDRLTVVPLVKRVVLLATSHSKLENDNKKLEGALARISNMVYEASLDERNNLAVEIRRIVAEVMK